MDYDPFNIFERQNLKARLSGMKNLGLVLDRASHKKMDLTERDFL